jgi:hypothetical protein
MSGFTKQLQEHAKRSDKIIVDIYRDFEIVFRKETGMFGAFSDRFDRESSHKSFAAAKKQVDDFLKAQEQENFVPFKVRRENYSECYDKELIVVGKNKGGSYAARTKDGAYQQITNQDFKRYVISSSIDSQKEIEISSIKDEIILLQKKARELHAQQKTISMYEHLKNRENE